MRTLARGFCNLAEERIEPSRREAISKEHRVVRRAHERTERSAEVARLAIRACERRVVESPNAARDLDDRSAADRQRTTIARRKRRSAKKPSRGNQIRIVERAKILGEQGYLFELRRTSGNHFGGGGESFHRRNGSL